VVDQGETVGEGEEKGERREFEQWREEPPLETTVGLTWK
jgi:hypothetical protein